MSVKNEHNNIKRLGDYIELCDERNSNLTYGFDDVRGCSNSKEIQLTKADISNRSFDKFLVIQPKEFIFNRRTTRMGERLGLGYNNTEQTFIFTEDYVGFRVKDSAKLLSDYLYIFFLRSEFDRYVRYDSWGSATEFFNWESMCEVKIPLPDIEIQQELVDTYNGLKALAEQNEALIKPLTEACQAYIVDCKRKYPEVELGDYIEECRLKNNEDKYGLNELQGVTSNSVFDNSKADTKDLLFDNYKIVHINEFAYNPSRINIGSIARQTKTTCIISPMYIVFKIVSDLLMPEYLQILFSRKEFRRSTLFYAMGSVRDTFDFNLMKEVKIPLPPPEVQQAIVNLYNCAEEAKRIATEAREKIKTLCPALIQRAING